MSGGEIHTHPIQLLVNYWEIRPSLMGAHLDELIRHGANRIATFVPWQAVESDITHTLPRFLQAVADRKMSVSLILTPEVGVHYANSGLPKDIASNPENAARSAEGGTIPVSLPPNAFALPSLSAPEFAKRYHNFLSRLDTLLADLGKTQPHLLQGVTAVLTGGFWKYYRGLKASSTAPFGGLAGDFSGAAGVVYRQRMDSFFAQREFTDPTPSAATRWKVRGMEEVNRRWFYQQSEDVFRSRSTQFVRKKANAIQVQQMELFTPEADPGFAYSHFLQVVSGGHADFSRLSALLEESASRGSAVNGSATLPYVHWTASGSFRSLSDSEKQYLILKSLLLLATQGGGILMDEEEWFSLSENFRNRAEGLAKLITHQELTLRTRALYLSSHLWSASGTLWEELSRRVGPQARLVSSMDRVLGDLEAQLLVVDPSIIFTSGMVKQLCEWAKGGRVVALPRSLLYTEAAKQELERSLVQDGKMDINLGVRFGVHVQGQGKLVVYDLPEGPASMRGEALSAWQKFLTSLLSIAEIEVDCTLSDARLQAICLERPDGDQGLFLMNGCQNSVAADLFFKTEVSVSDLSVAFAGPKNSAQASAPAVPANRFALEVPPCGVLPLAVGYVGADRKERREAALNAPLTAQNIEEAARSELPGFDPTKDINSTWN